ncbi:MAG: hypothetical protein ACP5R4_08400 [Armatimonadota bacterium]
MTTHKNVNTLMLPPICVDISFEQAVPEPKQLNITPEFLDPTPMESESRSLIEPAREAETLLWQIRRLQTWLVVLGISQVSLLASMVALGVLVASRVDRRAQQVGIAPSTVRARRIEVVNSQGRVVAALGGGENNQSALHLLTPDGKERVTLASSDRAGATLILRDAVGRPRALLKTDQEGRAELHLLSALGKSVFNALVGAERGVTMRICDSAGNPRIQLLVAEDGHPGVVLSHRDGKRRAVLFVDNQGNPSLALAGQSGKSKTVAP